MLTWFDFAPILLNKTLKMKTLHLLLLGFLVTSVLAPSCKEDEDVVDCDAYHWGYEGEEDDDTWLNCYADCDGQSQSPIDIAGSSPDAALAALETHYEAVPIELINNGHTVEFEYEAGSVLKLNGVDFTLAQFHFHTESEHTIIGTHYPMEVHLVHKNAAGDLAVVGVMFEEGAENAFLKNFSDHLPASKDDHYSSSTLVNAGDLLPPVGAYYTYSGSLTTPPCSEIVTWFVMKTPVQASSTQIQNMHAITHDNNRSVQGANGRAIKEYN
jgi:carbonic anhydrase